MRPPADALLLQTLRRDLPQFPEEVLNEWIAPCARGNGWPPIGSVWVNVLLGLPIYAWAAMTWTEEDRPLDWGDLSSDSVRIVRRLYDAHFNRDPAAAALVPQGGFARVMSAMAYLQEHGVMPGHIAVAEGPDGRLALADGYHRATAYFTYRNILSVPALRASLSPPVSVTKVNQPMWVARI